MTPRQSHAAAGPRSTGGRAASAPERPRSSTPAERVRRALQDHAHVGRLARMFKALGDPTRSKLVYALSLGEMRVGDLADALGTSMSATSHQLRILRDLDIVRVRRDGKAQVYSLNEQAFGFCSPRVCTAWKSALKPDPLLRPEGRS